MYYSNIKLIEELPISKFESQISEKLLANSNLIVIGETGSGKTTQIPLILLKTFSKIQNLAKGKIAVTEPRRLAATSVSKYVSSLVGDELGQSIGYKIRFDEIKSEDTKVLFMTDGILLREAQIDPLLLEYSVVMVDEAHERNINSDFLIGLLVDIQKQRRVKGLVPLKILVTSATLEKDKFINFLNKLPEEKLDVIEVPGRLFPIKSHFESRDVWDFQGRAAEITESICKNKEKGDILIFMPGKGEIDRTKKAIEVLPNFEKLNLEIITVHADLPMDEQNRIFKQSEKRKVVIATNIAETSLTVPGVKFVIDSGLIKVMEFDPHSGINSLITKPHARKGLEQRRGRAGRIEPGEYFAMYTEKSFNSRQEFPIPEILRTSLSHVILIMKILGIDDIEGFNFIDHPDKSLIDEAIRELKRLGAIDQNDTITQKGETMASLPLEPRLANLIIEANKNKCVKTICTIAAFLELKPVILNLTQEDILKKLIEDMIKYQREVQSIEELGHEIAKEGLKKESRDEVDITLTDQELKELEHQSSRLFQEYENKKKNLAYRGSDFLTLLKIFANWERNEMQPAWAEHNFLSAETLQEATNIRGELIEIAEQNGIEPIDKGGNDLNQRIERTLVNAFKFNTLAIQPNGFYKNVRSKDKNIKIHISSVLMDDKPKFAVAFEIIEISDIDSKPKLSAKFLHSVDDRMMQNYFPEVYREEMRSNKNSGRNRDKFRNRKFRFKNRKRRR